MAVFGMPLGMEWVFVCIFLFIPLVVIAIVLALFFSRRKREVPAPIPAAAPGWLPDPWGRHEVRYWNGSAWTGRVSDQGTESEDAVGQSPST